MIFHLAWLGASLSLSLSLSLSFSALLIIVWRTDEENTSAETQIPGPTIGYGNRLSDVGLSLQEAFAGRHSHVGSTVCSQMRAQNRGNHDKSSDHSLVNNSRLIDAIRGWPHAHPHRPILTGPLTHAHTEKKQTAKNRNILPALLVPSLFSH